MQQAMKADTDAAIEAFGKNEQVKRVFWTHIVVAKPSLCPADPRGVVMERRFESVRQWVKRTADRWTWLLRSLKREDKQYTEKRNSAFTKSFF
jgi:hypothetical protein